MHLVARLSRLWNRPANKSKSERRNRRYTPCFHLLEDRIVPTNQVTATAVGGVLTIVALDDLSPAAIAAGDNDQNIVLTGAGAGNFTITSPGAVTTIIG